MRNEPNELGDPKQHERSLAFTEPKSSATGTYAEGREEGSRFDLWSLIPSHRDCSSPVNYSTDKTFNNGKHWNSFQKDRRVLVSGSFAREIDHVAKPEQWPVDFIGDGEIAEISVDTICRTLKLLLDEREDFLRETLELMESAALDRAEEQKR